MVLKLHLRPSSQGGADVAGPDVTAHGTCTVMRKEGGAASSGEHHGPRGFHNPELLKALRGQKPK